MNVDATLKTDGANITELLNMAKAYGVGAAQMVSGTGKLSANLHVQGLASDPSKLVYSGGASISNATVTTPELAKPLAVSSANAQFSQNTVSMTGLAASLGGTTVHGNLSAKNFSAPNVQFALAADTIDTADVGGTQVGGYLNTALANNKGELVIPVLVTGSLPHPTFTPDAQALAKMKLNNLLPTTADPAKLTGGLLGQKGAGGILKGVLGAGSGQQQQKSQQSQQQPKQQNQVDSLLKQLPKKKR